MLPLLVPEDRRGPSVATRQYPYRGPAHQTARREDGAAWSGRRRRTPRQGVAHARLGRLPAARAPVAMDRVLGHHQREALGYVVRVARAGVGASLQRPLAMRTARRAMGLPLVNDFRPRPPMPLVPRLLPRLLPRLAPRLFAAPRRVGLLVNRLHARRRGRRTDRRALALQPPQLRGQLQKREDHRLLAPRVNRPRLLRRQVRPQREIQNATRRHDIDPPQSCVRPMSHNHQDQLQTAKVLRHGQFVPNSITIHVFRNSGRPVAPKSLERLTTSFKELDNVRWIWQYDATVPVSRTSRH